MDSIEEGVVIIEMGPHDITDIPAASLLELCRSVDAEMGKSLKCVYSGLCIYEYFKRLTEVRKVANYEDIIRCGHECPKEEVCCDSGDIGH